MSDVRLAASRGGPADFATRIQRAAAMAAEPASVAQLTLLIAILEHQQARARVTHVAEAALGMRAGAVLQGLSGRTSLLDPSPALEPAPTELRSAAASLGGLETLPPPLLETADELARLGDEELRTMAALWLDDPSAVHPRREFWLRVALGAVLEPAAAGTGRIPREKWTAPICPACGGSPQVSVISEESGEFLAGSPRSLVCSRCALWWTFPRAKCIACGEDNSTRLHSFSDEDRPAVRIDMCDSCSSYVKTFDLRKPGGAEVVPLVDDVATLVLDVWAHEQGLRRPIVSFAGV